MDSSRLNDAVAARVVAWHNRHPLARRIGAAQVHSVGYVVLPFACPNAEAPPSTSLEAGSAQGSLRERALARARQGGEAVPPPAAPSPPAPASGGMPPDARANFDEDFIAPLRPTRVARWAHRHGVPLAALPPVPGSPVREVLPLPLPAGTQPLHVVLLTAAIDTGTARHRVLLGAGDTAPVLGRRIPNHLRAGLLLALLSGAGAVALRPDGEGPTQTLAALVAAWGRSAASPAEVVRETAVTAAEPPRPVEPTQQGLDASAGAPLLVVHAAEVAASQPAGEEEAMGGGGPAPGAAAAKSDTTARADVAVPAVAAPDAVAVAGAPAKDATAPSVTVAVSPSESASASALASASAPATGAAATAWAPPNAEPRLGRIELPPLGLPRSRLAKNEARDAWLGALGVPAIPASAAAAARAAASSAPTPTPTAGVTQPAKPSAATSAPPPQPTSFAVASRVGYMFGEDAQWRCHARYTLASGVIATLSLFLPGVAYYVFIAVVIVWFEVTAIRLWRLAGG